MVLWAMLMAGSAMAASPKLIGCDGEAKDPVATSMPIGPGPLVLAKIYCLDLPASFPLSPPDLAPDGRALFASDSVEGLWLASLDAPSDPRHFDGPVPSNRVPPFAWSKNSRAVLGVRQEAMKPSGFARGPLEPFLFSIDGKDQPLPALVSSAGPLDEIYWVGRAGMAIAAFGT